MTAKILKIAAACALFTIAAAVMYCAPTVPRPGTDVSTPAEKTKKTAKTVSDDGQTIWIPDDDRRDPKSVITQEEADSIFGEGLERAEFERLEDTLFAADPLARVVGPVSGGKATIYLHRGFMDDAVSDLVRLNPFGDDGLDRGVFMVTDSTHRRLEFTLANRITRANGRRATSLDFIELWSRFMKSRPAQGLALFRNVQGAENFVNGKDPLVGGFNAADENTIRIRFAKPDPLAFQRLSSPKLIGGPFLLGAYYTSAAKGAEMKLLPNANSLTDTAFLAECVIQTGGDPDHMMSFSTGQYSAMTLYLAADLDVARKELVGEEEGKASLRKLPADRYFLACKTEDEQTRRFVHGIADGADMLKNAVMAEGEEIASVAPASVELIRIPRNRPPVPQLPKPFRILYRDDDPVSVAVAEKLHADLTAAGMLAETAPANAERYEIALVRGTYDCAVGWVQETILENQTEQLHFASIWFADETNPQTRLREYREIPLFYVNNYMLLRNDTRLHGDKITGIWVMPPPPDE